MTGPLTPAVLGRVAAAARADGLLSLGAVALDDPGFEPARAELRRFLAAGRAGEMRFLARTETTRAHPERMLAGSRSLLVALVPYRGEAGPIARYAQSADYHTVVHHRLEKLAGHLAAELPGVGTLVCVDTKPVLERAAAALAGLGFLGKHGCLIAPGLGSYVLLGCLLCTAEWTGPRSAIGAAPPWDACGSCRACLDACPTGAFSEPGRLDPRRCISYLTIEHRGAIADELADRMGDRIAGCDACQEACPYNRGEARSARVSAAAWLPSLSRPAAPVDLVSLARLGNSRHRAFVRHTALRRIPRRSLRRNALLALGNRAAPLSADERSAVERVADDPDPQIRRAAARALRRRG